LTLTLTPLNSVQKIPEVGINDTSAVLGSEVVYTCPAGKKAKGIVTCTVNSYTPAGSVRFRAAGSKICNFVEGVDPVGSIQNGSFTIAAGETLLASASGGVISGMDWAVTIQETPV